jgi:chlorite dismutase
MHNPQVPETLEGWSVLHQMFRIRWEALRALPATERETVTKEATEIVTAMVGREAGSGRTGLVQLLGHKGDLMFIHFRRTFDELSQAGLDLTRTGLWALLEPTTSYVSVVEIGMYEMTAKIHRMLAEWSLHPGTPAYDEKFDAEMAQQRQRMSGRLFCEIPARRYVCFYPMNKRRSDSKNWYATPFDKRAAMMLDHGAIGRQYSGAVTQIISGSIGFDDWEWGVDLFADDPVVFKKLVYEMRFDEASSDYGEFGPFYTGVQFSADELQALLAGRTPALHPR